ncbi:helix-turn-helix domain-containing protein [archaeon]|nr:helix-turn-helix domain-containing protein [Nanoarchaeota archaeon]MCG2723722.1 helix-turn-helix domain-containing protein [archaeon]
MSYVRIKIVNGRKYKYFVTGKRIDGSVKQKVIRYLGPIEPVYKFGKRHKSNASIYARKPTKEEFEALKNASKSTSSFTKDRARIILLSAEKLFSKPIAERVGCEERKVRDAIKAFNKNGLNSLERKKAKGAEPKFTEEIKKNILLNFSKEPKEFGYVFTAWTLPRFKKHLVEKNVVKSISIESVRQILNKSGAKLEKSKRWQYSPDKNFFKKSRL